MSHLSFSGCKVTQAERVHEFIECACSLHCASADSNGQNFQRRAEAMLRDHPELATANLITACLSGEARLVGEMLDSEPALANQRFEPRGWPPLLYLCFSRFLRKPTNPQREQNLLDCAQLLLGQGADPNAFFMLGDEKETALYGAVGVCNHPELAESLLKHGALVDDPDGSYHVAEFEDTRCVRVLFERGMNAEHRATVLLRKLDFEDPRGMKEILSYGADANARGIWGKSPLQQAILRGRSLEIIQTLLESGAEPNSQPYQGKSTYFLACQSGRQDVLSLLEAHGCKTDLPPEQAVVAALLRGELESAIQLAKQAGRTAQDLAAEDSNVIVAAAQAGNMNGVRALLEFGFPANAQDEQGFSALHWAAWYGHLELTDLLVQKGAPLELENNYGGTVIDSLVWGCVHSNGNRGQLSAVLKLLVDAGADPSKISPWPTGDDEIDLIVRSLTRLD